MTDVNDATVPVQYSREHSNSEGRDFLFTYNTEHRFRSFPDDTIVIKWSCGDAIGCWTVEQFEELLKKAAKGTFEFPFAYRSEDRDALLWIEGGEIHYSDGYVEEHDTGPVLAEFRKDLRNLKAKIKKEAPANAEA